MLIIFPLLFILASSIWTGAGRMKQWVLGALLVWQFADVAGYYPHFLPYTNNLISDKKMAYSLLADTNLAYGEGGHELERYLTEHPHAIYAPAGPVSGEVVVEVNDFLDLNMGTLHRYDWLKNLQPTGHIHSQYLIFDIKAR